MLTDSPIYKGILYFILIYLKYLRNYLMANHFHWKGNSDIWWNSFIQTGSHQHIYSLKISVWNIYILSLEKKCAFITELEILQSRAINLRKKKSQHGLQGFVSSIIPAIWAMQSESHKQYDNTEICKHTHIYIYVYINYVICFMYSPLII